MIVMPSNNTGSEVRSMAVEFPGRLALLISPGGWRMPPEGMDVALDNAKFAAWIKGTPWCGLRFHAFLRSVAAKGVSPRWVVVPDVVTDRDATLSSWHEWAPRLRGEYGWPLAVAVQDGMTAADVHPLGADVVFVGGSTEWKWGSLLHWTQNFPRVHVGRVNTRRQLLMAKLRGAESVDGTGFFRGDQGQLAGLKRFLRES